MILLICVFNMPMYVNFVPVHSLKACGAEQRQLLTAEGGWSRATIVPHNIDLGRGLEICGHLHAPAALPPGRKPRYLSLMGGPNA
jgi:hypothetical protein